MTYIAQELLYDKTLAERLDPETGAPRQVEAGYVQPGQAIDLDDTRAEILLAIGAVVPAAPAEVAPSKPEAEPEPEAPKRRR